MATKIEWTDETLNALVGCSRVSAGCEHCYAENISHVRAGNPRVGAKFAGTTRKSQDGRIVWTGKVNFDEDTLLKPLKWKKPRRVFVNALSDLFHPNVPDEVIDKHFALFALCPQHTFQILTKRPERMRDYVNNVETRMRMAAQIENISREMFGDIVEHATFLHQLEFDKGLLGTAEGYEHYVAQYPLPNVWLGVSVENQAQADERIPLLLETPAAVRFLSCEPLLGSVNVREYLTFTHKCQRCRYYGMEEDFEADFEEDFEEEGEDLSCPECGDMTLISPLYYAPDLGSKGAQIDWIITGGESGPKARPCQLEWVRRLRDDCIAASVPFFMKQLGANLAQELGCSDTKGGDITEWPADLRIRQCPGEC